MLPAKPAVEERPAENTTTGDPLDSALPTASPKTDALSAKPGTLPATENGFESDKPGELDFLQSYY